MNENTQPDGLKVPISFPIMFAKDEYVFHPKGGGTYQIVGLPTEYVLEGTREPAYAYRLPDGRICVRCQSEMEDGRFIMAPSQPSIKAAAHKTNGIHCSIGYDPSHEQNSP